MDVARTDEVRRILSERKTLEFKCIAAKAVKTFGLPYFGVVPETLEILLVCIRIMCKYALRKFAN